jgi:hypothetical protein
MLYLYLSTITRHFFGSWIGDLVFEGGGAKVFVVRCGNACWFSGDRDAYGEETMLWNWIGK